jgi:hypothetical protein
MKTAFLYLLLVTYTTSLLRPVLPYISDAAAHIFWYSKHVSTVHIENGKYHVHVEAFNAAKKTDTQKSTFPGKSAAGQEEYMINHFDLMVTLWPSSLQHFVRPELNRIELFSSITYPPPRI